MATGTYSDNSTQDLTSQVTWASGSTSVATITAAGLATGVGVGTSTISTTLSGVTGTTVLTVNPAVLQSIALTPAGLSVTQGLTEQFTATGTYSDGSTANITSQATWASAAPSVATISNAAGTQGLATAVAPGTAGITATLDSVVSSVDTLTVTLSTQLPTLNPIAEQTVEPGTAVVLTASVANPVAGEAITYSLDPGAPEGATIDANSGAFRFMTSGAPATYRITVRATYDGMANLSATTSFNINVQSNGPALSSPNATGITSTGSKRKGLTAITIAFDEALNASSAMNSALYSVLGAVTKRRKTTFSKDVAFLGASYNGSMNSVTLMLAKPYKGKVQVTVSPGIVAASGAASGKSFSFQT
jgi:hypothetical protein